MSKDEKIALLEAEIVGLVDALTRRDEMIAELRDERELLLDAICCIVKRMRALDLAGRQSRLNL